MSPVIECGACWAEAVRLATALGRPTAVNVLYRGNLAQQDRAADRGEDTTGHE